MTQPLRESVTAAAAAGFLAGGCVRLAAGAALEPTAALLGALRLAGGAVAAAVVAGILVNLAVLPAILRIVPGRRLPRVAYGISALVCAVAAFAVAIELPSAGG